MHTYMALYDTREQAEAAQARLRQLGIKDVDGSILDRSSPGFADADRAGSGGGLWGGLKGAPPSDDDGRFYEESLRRGGYLLTVNADERSHEQVLQVLEGSGAVDIDERRREYERAGHLAAAPAPAVRGGAEERIPVVEEQLRVGKRVVERGGVRVRTYVASVPVHEQVTLHEERVQVERRPVDQLLGAAHADAFRERDIEVTERGEEAVVGKEARVVEEVVVRKSAEDCVDTVRDTVRRTEVDVERTNDASGGSSRSSTPPRG